MILRNPYWSFGTHESYLYTLPFHFNQLDDFSDFDGIRSTDSTILNSPGTWYHVQSLDLSNNCNLNENLLEQIQIQMPNLNSITLKLKQIDYLSKINPIGTTFDSIIIVHGERELLESGKNWFNDIFPNAKHLVLSYSPQAITYLSQKLRSRASLSNDQIGTNDIYFPQIQRVASKLLLEDIYHLYEYVLPVLLEISEMFPNVKSFTLNFYRIQKYSSNLWLTDLHELITLLNINQIFKDFSIEHISNQLEFVKKEK